MAPLWPFKRAYRRRPDSPDAMRSSVDEELEFHIEMAAEEYRRQGLSTEEARRRAAEDFGDLEYTREYCTEQTTLRETEARGVMRLEELRQDLAFTIRTLKKNWSYTAVVVVTLAFGIAANTLIFSVMNPYFFRALPYADAEELVQLGQIGEDFDWARFSLGQLSDWTERSQAFQDVGAYHYNVKNLTGPEGPQRELATFMTDNLFEVLGSTPLMGRTIRPGEGGPGGADVIVLSESLWRTRYGSDPGILGRSVELDGVPHTVIGVMPHAFSFPFNEVRMWVPVREDVASQGRTWDNYIPIARLNEGWTAERARTELEAIQRDFATLYPDEEGAYSGVNVRSIRAALNFAWDPLRISFGILLAAVVCVLMIACVNVASLTLARATTRGREVAVRAAIGADRRRLISQFLTESVVLALIGGAVGIVLAYWGAAALGPVIPEGLYRVGDVEIDTTVLLFTLVLTLVTPVLFGLLPALNATKTDLASTIREGDRGAGGAGMKGRRFLVVAEVAMAIALIAGTGLMIRSFSQVQAVDVGFDAERALVVELTTSEYAYGTTAEVEDFYSRVEEALAGIPGVTGVGQTAWLPLNNATLAVNVARPGEEPATLTEWPRALRGRVSPGYFDAMGIPLVEGRLLGQGDGADAEPVAVVSRLFQERFFPGESAVGRTMSQRTADGHISVRIVGVVEDVKHRDLNGPTEPYYYRPLAQTAARTRHVVVQAAANPERLAPQVRRTLSEVDPNVAFGLRPMSEVVQQGTLIWALGSAFLGIFGLGALLLASLGIYGVISYSVSQRKREMGIRIAMGASTADIRKVVVSDGLRMTGIGVVIGLVLALLVGQLMQAVLFGVSPVDPATLGGVLTLFLLVSVVASAVPAIRAGRVDPLKVLKAE